MSLSSHAVDLGRVQDLSRLGHRYAERRDATGQVLEQKGRAEVREARPQLGCGLPGKDRGLDAGVDRAGVQAFVERHQADSGPVVAGEDGSFHRRCAPPAWKKREMQVHHRHLSKHIGADERPEGHDDAELDVCVQDVGYAARHREPELERALLHRRRRERAPAAATTVGGGHDKRHVVAGIVQGPQEADRDLRRAEESEPCHRPRPEGSGSGVAAGLGGAGERPGPQDTHGLFALVPLETLEEQDAIEVVELMLEDPTEQLVGFDRELVSLKVVAHEMDLLRPDDQPVQVGDRQAALLVLPLAAGLDYLRIDHRHGTFTDVVDEYPALDAHLRRRKAYARRGVHRLEHLLGEADDLAVDLLDLHGTLAKDGVAEYPDREDGHGATLPVRGRRSALQPCGHGAARPATTPRCSQPKRARTTSPVAPWNAIRAGGTSTTEISIR